jgi:hypothetical protein
MWSKKQTGPVWHNVGEFTGCLTCTPETTVLWRCTALSAFLCTCSPSLLLQKPPQFTTPTTLPGSIASTSSPVAASAASQPSYYTPPPNYYVPRPSVAQQTVAAPTRPPAQASQAVQNQNKYQQQQQPVPPPAQQLPAGWVVQETGQDPQATKCTFPRVVYSLIAVGIAAAVSELDGATSFRGEAHACVHVH